MSPDSLELWQGVGPVLDAFDDLGVDWLISGSVASSTLGIARATQDVDVVADLRRGHGVALASRLGEDYMADAGMIESAIARRASCNFVHLSTMVKVDVFVHSGTRFATEQMRRRRAVELPGADRRVHVASVEDLVLQKLAWYRDGGCRPDRQWLDVQGLLRMNRDGLEVAHLRAWAPDLDVVDLLARALVEAGSGSPP